LKSLLGAVDDDFFHDDSDGDTGRKSAMLGSPIRRGRPKTSKYTKKKPAPGASSKEIDAFEKDRKAFYDESRWKKLKSPPKRPATDFTGDHHPTLRTMAEVEKSRLSKGQTFKSRALVLLRTKEEANLRGLSITVVKADTSNFVCWSRESPSFVVIASQTLANAWTVKTALVRELDTDPDWNGEIPRGEEYSFITLHHIKATVVRASYTLFSSQ
jgi:hypothetical protein